MKLTRMGPLATDIWNGASVDFLSRRSLLGSSS